MKHWWHHPMTYSWHHWPSYDVIGFPYKRRRSGPIGDWLHLGLRVHFGSMFNWLLRVLMHARIDVLTRPCHRSLLPSSILIGVVITVSAQYVPMPLSTPTHPMSITSTTLCASFTGLSSFRLVLVCTIYRVVVYISGSIPLSGWHIIFPRGAHDTYTHWGKKFISGRCGQKFTFQSGLNLHRNLYRWVHPYECFATNCKRKYKWPQDLLKHIKCHLKIVLKCKACTYSTHERRLLRQHKNTHSTDKKYECGKQCGMKFKHEMQRYHHEHKCNPV